MGLAETLLLGFIAGATILIGLPVGRIRRPLPATRALLNATAVGVLIFLMWDVLSHAWAPIDAALVDIHGGHGGLGRVFGYGGLFLVGLSAGLLGLVSYERWMKATVQRLRPLVGPGAMTISERPGRLASWSQAQHLSLLIAVGIGLHNFAEGLAIGQSAASNEVALATLLVIGFALHNATEGFGIVAPLAAGSESSTERPTWRFLALMGLIGGGPTFVGTAIGHGFTSAALSVAFLTLAAGSILYVVIQLLGIASKLGRSNLLAAGILFGLLAGFVTDAIVTAAGA